MAAAQVKHKLFSSRRASNNLFENKLLPASFTERDCIVVDIGQAYIRIGFAGDPLPLAVFRTVSKLETYASQLQGEQRVLMEKWLAHDLSLHGLLQLGDSVAEEAIKSLLLHAFNLVAENDPRNFDVIVTHDSQSSFCAKFRSVVATILFGLEFGAEQVAFADQAFMAALVVIEREGLLVNSGASVTTVLPVIYSEVETEFHVRPLINCVQQTAICGDMVTHKLRKAFETNPNLADVAGAKRHFIFQEMKACAISCILYQIGNFLNTGGILLRAPVATDDGNGSKHPN